MPDRVMGPPVVMPAVVTRERDTRSQENEKRGENGKAATHRVARLRTRAPMMRR
jgi:hypothetical protein